MSQGSTALPIHRGGARARVPRETTARALRERPARPVAWVRRAEPPDLRPSGWWVSRRSTAAAPWPRVPR